MGLRPGKALILLFEQLERDAKINPNLYLKEKQYNLLELSEPLLGNGWVCGFLQKIMSMLVFAL
jgi:hypothetical protein